MNCQVNHMLKWKALNMGWATITLVLIMGEVVDVKEPKKICDVCGYPNNINVRQCARCGNCLSC